MKQEWYPFRSYNRIWAASILQGEAVILKVPRRRSCMRSRLLTWSLTPVCYIGVGIKSFL